MLSPEQTVNHSDSSRYPACGLGLLQSLEAVLGNTAQPGFSVLGDAVEIKGVESIK